MSTYFDFAATTPLDPGVLEKMLPYFGETYGNPSSIHQAGQKAEHAVEQSRKIVAAALGSKPEEITFTSGATESNNLALRGIAHTQRERYMSTRIVTTAVEHPSVLQTCQQLERLDGFELNLLSLDETGQVQIDQIAEVIGDDAALVSVVYANNEIGTINPIAAIGRLCRDRGIPFHVDAAQAANHLPLHIDELNVDLMTLGAHKFYGPKGIGVLYHRQGIDFTTWQTGGSQEFGTRAGTHNVPSIVGFAAALETARAMAPSLSNALEPMRDDLIEGILSSVPDVQLTGHHHDRLHNHTSFCLKEVDSNQLLGALDLAGFSCSSGSACKTGNPEPSPVLLALGYPLEWAVGSLRITLGRSSTSEQIDALLEELPQTVYGLRANLQN